MYSVTAKIHNCYSQAASEKYPASWKVQLLGDHCMEDGQLKSEMISLNVPREVFEKMKGKEGETVTLPISFFAAGNVTVFYPKNAQIEA